MSYVLELPLHTLRYLQSAFKDFCYVFCKHDIDDYNGEDFSWLDVKHVPYCKSRYMDHVTRAFKCRSHVVTVSMVRFSTTSLFLMRAEAVASSEIVNSDDPKLVYMVVDSCKLPSTEQGSTDMDQPFGGCMFVYQGFIYPSYFEIYFPYLVFHKDFSSQHKIFLYCHISHMEFKYNHAERIVLPGMKIASFIEVTLTSPATSLTISKLKVELWEILYKREGNGYSQTLEVHPIHSSNDTCTLTNKDGKFTVPSTMLSGEIPKLDPTSCNGYLIRRYAIRIKVTFEGTTESRRVDINLAKDCRSCSYDHPPKYKESLSYEVGHFFITGRFNGYTFDPKTSGNNFIKKMSHNDPIDRTYESHLTLSYKDFATNKVLTFTTVKWSSIVKACKKTCFKNSKYGSRLQWGWAIPKGIPTMYYRGLKYGFIIVGARYWFKNISYVVPPTAFPQVFGNLHSDFNMERCQLSGIIKTADMCHGYTLFMRARFVEPREYNQKEGSRLVFPGMRVTEFVKISFELSDQFLVSEVTKGSFGYEFQVSRIEIRVMEVIEHFKDTNILHCKHLSTMVHESDCHYKLRWRHVKAHEKRDSIDLPSFLFECKLPKLKPSFISEKQRRSHGLGIKVFILANFGSNPDSTALSVWLPFNIGKLEYYLF